MTDAPVPTSAPGMRGRDVCFASTAEEEAARDARGRFPGAPAWSGDLATAPTAALIAHDAALVAVLGNLAVKHPTYGAPGWAPRSPGEQIAAGFNRYRARLIATRNELSCRDW